MIVWWTHKACEANLPPPITVASSRGAYNHQNHDAIDILHIEDVDKEKSQTRHEKKLEHDSSHDRLCVLYLRLETFRVHSCTCKSQSWHER